MARHRPWLAWAAAFVVAGCSTLLDIDTIEFGDGTATGTGTAGGGGSAGGAAGTGGTGGEAGAAGGTGGAGGAGGSSCVFGPFGDPTNLVELNSTASDWDPTISSDGLTLYFGSDRTGTLGGDDIWYATRSTVGSSFDAPQNLGELNTPYEEDDAELSFDGLTLYFASDRLGGQGSHDLYYATRSSTDDPFDPAQPLTELNSSAEERDPAVTHDELAIFFASSRTGSAGSLDLWVATRSSTAQPFGAPTNVTELNSAAEDSNPGLSPDGLTLYFSSGRTGGVGDDDVWYATRATLTSPFGDPENLTAVNTTYADADPALSADGLTLYFGSSRPAPSTGGDLYVTTRSCE